MNKYHLDFESRSAADLRKYGAHRYASDPTAAILLAGICCGDGPVLMWDRYASPEQNAPALALMAQMVSDPSATMTAHNVNFEAAIIQYLWKSTFNLPEPQLEQYRCTATLCRVAAIPSSLEQAANFMNLSTRKDTAGKSLIGAFCVPKDGVFLEPTATKTITVGGKKMTVAAAWQLFVSYCRQDVETERELEKRLTKLELKGWLLEAFQMDLRLNNRGIPINIPAVINAERVVNSYNLRLGNQFRELTGYSASQTAKVLYWLQARGYQQDDLRAGTISAVLGMADEEEDGDAEPRPDSATELLQMTPEAIEALKLRALLSFAALKKLPTMREAACPDGKVRGTSMFWGAMRTGRDSSKILQTQNMRRPTVDNTAGIYAELCAGELDDRGIEVLYGPPLESVASSIRHFIDPGPGREFIDIDFSQIEARVLPWLARHEELLDTFRQGRDLYKTTISMTFAKPYEEVTKAERQLGKVIVLAAGFGGGVRAMEAACTMFKIEMTDKERRAVIKAWRAANRPIVLFWKACQEAALEAIENPGTWVFAGRAKFGCTGDLGFRRLIAKLPSGKILSYPYPEVKEVFKVRRPKPGQAEPFNEEIVDEVSEEIEYEWKDIPRAQAVDADGNPHDGVWRTKEISYYGQIKQSVKWGRIRTHGGVFCENLTQSVAADFLKIGAIRAEKRGYEPVMFVHDQLIANYRPEEGNTVEGLIEALCELPPWAEGMPLEAVGDLAPYYRKD